MKPTVTIRSIGDQYILEDEKYKFILSHLNEPLPLANVWFHLEGGISSVSVRYEDSIITLFTKNNIKGEFNNGIELRFS